MSRMQLVGGAIAAALCLGSIGSSGDPAPALCASQPAEHVVVPRRTAQWAEGVRLFGGLGGFHRAVTTNSPEAQAYFDQGMRLLWAFNHDEATAERPGRSRSCSG